MRYRVIYDGECNLCATFVQLLENFDKGNLFDYSPMQDRDALEQLGIMPQDCEMGMILIDAQNPSCRWQGSDAAEEIANLLPMGYLLVKAYRSLPGMKWAGDRAYEQIRDNRYSWFGRRSTTYLSANPFGCAERNRS
jgi:predicted DCC family thiol-disulfide oxidoreductase YuxK